MQRRSCFAILLFVLLFVQAVPIASAQTPPGDGRPDQAVLRFGGEVGLAAIGDYLSPPTQAARPFDFMLLRREASVPDGATMTLTLRVSTDGKQWSDWRVVPESDDLWMPSDGPDVWWSEIMSVGAAMRFWQVQVRTTPAHDGSLPELRRIDVNTVDTSSFAPRQAPQATTTQVSPSAVGKPAVVSRTAWGSPDGQGSRASVARYNVTHLVVHHTADSNERPAGGWAARVRAIWSFHTITRGWGDIGYNYLIDPDGVIYEGRAGGDDAVGFHDTANYGSMGVSLIGTYASVAPSAAAQNALVNILAWKASQKGIDPLGNSYYYGCARSSYCKPFNAGGFVPNIAGHRQVTPGHTTCPGDAIMALLPSIRSRVAERMGGALPGDNGDLLIDNLEHAQSSSAPGFFKSNANWHEQSCGYGGHTYYTYATDGNPASSNWATWRPNIPTTGTYRVYAYIPQGCGIKPTSPYASSKASYTINHASGSSTVVVDHDIATPWVDLGLYTFNKGTNGFVRLSDLTGEPFSQQKVIFFDAVKLVPETASEKIELRNVTFDRTTLVSGELLKVTFRVRNTGSTTIYTQGPQASRTADGSAFNDGQGGRPDDAYVYDQGECFGGNTQGDYPSFPKEGNRFRVVLGPTNTSAIVGCAVDFGKYPWRWGLNGDLAPGAERDIIAYVRFREPGTYTLRANVLQEYVRYFYDETNGFKQATITVTKEQFKPELSTYDAQTNNLARVYRMGNVPDNFLARTHNPSSITRGEEVGTFVWNGGFFNWENGGPLPGLEDNFIIEQVRSFEAPVTGEYIFGINSDDGAWLWVDGQLVVDNSGLHGVIDPNEATDTDYMVGAVTGKITLSAGFHTLAFKYFERTGWAAAGYGVQMPGETSLRMLTDRLGGGAPQLGSTFISHPRLLIAADDTGGSGVDYIRFSWNGTDWLTNQPCMGRDCALLNLGALQNGSYTVYYEAVDKAGNVGTRQRLSFQVDTSLVSRQTFLPLLGRSPN
jgi:hypothetical protein